MRCMLGHEKSAKLTMAADGVGMRCSCFMRNSPMFVITSVGSSTLLNCVCARKKGLAVAMTP